MRSLAALALSAALLLLLAAAPAAAQDATSYEIRLQESGDAELTVETTMTLDTEEERAAFRELADDPASLDEQTSGVAREFRTIVERASNRTGRDMAVEDVRVGAASSGDAGVVTVRLTWTGFAATEGDALTVGDAFDPGLHLAPGESLTLSAPEGYRFRSAPAGAEEVDAGLRWTGETDALAGTAVAEPVEEKTTPGLAGAVVIWVIAAVAVLRRR